MPATPHAVEGAARIVTTEPPFVGRPRQQAGRCGPGPRACRPGAPGLGAEGRRPAECRAVAADIQDLAEALGLTDGDEWRHGVWLQPDMIAVQDSEPAPALEVSDSAPDPLGRRITSDEGEDVGAVQIQLPAPDSGDRQ